MESSSAKLNVLGMQQGDQDAFIGEVNPAPGEELMCGCLLGPGKNGSSACHGEEQEKTAGKHSMLQRRKGMGKLSDGAQDGGCDGCGPARNMEKYPVYPSESELKVEVVGEWIFITEKNVQELDPGEIVPDGRRFQGSAEKLSVSANGVNVGWKGRPLEMHTKPKVGTELCA